MIVHVLAAEEIVHIRPPIAPVTRRAAIVYVQNDVTLLRQKLFEEELAIIIIPAVDRVLQITRAMDEDDHRVFFLRVESGGKIDLRFDLLAVARWNVDEFWFVPVSFCEGLRCGTGELYKRFSWIAFTTITNLLKNKFVRLIPVRIAV